MRLDMGGKLRNLPDSARIFCAHEYTQSNARFAVTVDPENQALLARAAEIDATRSRGEPTVPDTMGRERLTNPFLRADAASVAAAVGLSRQSAAITSAPAPRSPSSNVFAALPTPLHGGRIASLANKMRITGDWTSMATLSPPRLVRGRKFVCFSSPPTTLLRW